MCGAAAGAGDGELLVGCFLQEGHDRRKTWINPPLAAAWADKCRAALRGGWRDLVLGVAKNGNTPAVG